MKYKFDTIGFVYLILCCLVGALVIIVGASIPMLVIISRVP